VNSGFEAFCEESIHPYPPRPGCSVCGSVVWCLAVYCGVLQCVAHCVAVCCSVLQTLLQCVAHCVAVCCIALSHELLQEVSMQYVAVCCSVLQCVVVLQCVAVCCSVLHCVAVCCTVLHCVLTRAASGSGYAVATVGRLDKIISLFCRILSLLQGSFAEYCLFYRALLQQRPICYRSYYLKPHRIPLVGAPSNPSRGGGLGSSTIFKKFNEPYAPS